MNSDCTGNFTAKSSLTLPPPLDWELVNSRALEIVERFTLAGGWIYRTEAYADEDDAVPFGIATTFVPTPEAAQ